MSGLFGLWRRLDASDVVREYGPKVHRHLKRIFGPAADIDDVYQQVFVEIVRSLPSFRGEAKLATWVRRITWNVAYQEMRVGYRNREDAAPVDELGGAGPEATLEQRDTLRRWYTLVETLEPKLRVVVTMYEVEGMTLKEMAEALGRPLPTVASQLTAARRALLTAMQRQRWPELAKKGAQE